ncbi:MAG: hypothetical protein GTN62_10125 [Gemmatimonadales bacterium]|nr:hypothetical protein [Gemmatimonadales bacterium]NIN11902.1 hypothetical protein [Gemmatimonadales bacterium]NIN50452.1 hypothetical protein [Gemmatimonadales bacterium]NIP07916.1 hypothetical protein [Gemmatimonadales bacterium]NIR01940.1 hypothetical protein [Gemmatimonadales bacterium]
MDVLLVTCAAMPGLHGDDRYLLRALGERGITAEPAVWEDQRRDWAGVRLCLIRSAWDYAYRRTQFVAWAEQVANVTRLWNPAPLVRWNTHKQYLCDLADRGVPTVPTVVLQAGTAVSLERVLSEHRWTDVVLKAAVAQTGRYAMRVSLGALEAGQAHLDRLLPYEDMLVQPYVPSVVQGGEVSVVLIDGEFTHAVQKVAAEEEFLVHDDFGGTVRPARLTRAQLRTAERALAALDRPTLYGRVDLVAGEGGQPAVMEFEVVEPELFFRYSPAAVERMVIAVERELTSAFGG